MPSIFRKSGLQDDAQYPKCRLFGAIAHKLLQESDDVVRQTAADGELRLRRQPIVDLVREWLRASCRQLPSDLGESCTNLDVLRRRNCEGNSCDSLRALRRHANEVLKRWPQRVFHGSGIPDGLGRFGKEADLVEWLDPS